MSLFPAFSDANAKEKQEKDDNNDENWLKNSSFKVDISKLSLLVNNEGENKNIKDKDPTKRNKSSQRKEESSKKHKKKKTEENPENLITKSDEFVIDKTSTKEYFSVNTISRPAVPKYDRKYSMFKKNRFNNKRYKRYFKLKLFGEEIKDNAIKKGDLDKKIEIKKNESISGFSEEINLTKTTQEYNQKLSQNPLDVQTWIDYVQFQDTVYNFEKCNKKGSIAKGNRVTADRKLSILDKALTHLPNNEKLQRERLNVCVNAFPSDELNIHLEKMVEKEQSNIILWQGYIESKQCSMSHCNTPTVLKLYTKCLSTLHQLRRTAKVEKSILEENILRMLYQCGLFLKQSGLFEQLWTLLRMYLNLNLSHQEKSNIFNGIGNGSVNDRELLKLEEIVLNSKLPLHELWLRIEKLREACHWVPFSGDENCEDPQRMVFVEDVNELIHPITMPGNTFKMTAISLTLLKVPLLPCRHTTMKNFGLDYVPWSLDSIETIVLPTFLRTHHIDLTSQHFLNYLKKFTVGPQYLKQFPGQEEYLKSILEIISLSIEALNGAEKTAIAVWMLRFHRVLLVLERKGFLNISKELQKKLKSDRKNLLKNSGNNIILYVEFGLIEIFTNDGVENGVNVLMATLKMQDNFRSIDLIGDRLLRSSLCFVYKTLMEIYLNEDDREKTLEYGLRLALGINLERNIQISESSLNEATLKFKHVTIKLFQNDDDSIIETVEHFLPNFLIDWITCQAIFMYYTKGIDETKRFLDEILLNFESKVFEKEIILEFYVSLVFKDRLKNVSPQKITNLNDLLFKSIVSYPNNVFFLTILSKTENLSCSIGKNFWKLKRLLTQTGHAFPNLFLILIEMEKINIIEETWVETVTNGCLKNKISSLFRDLTSSGVCTRRCGLIWRLYLQFLYENYDANLCRNVYYKAVEECPWLKALYIDAAVYIPAELPQIQDLLIEKQLRLHVTPEELDILRG
nr:protein NRDE2 homolog [Onthophagus taurus]XP_022910844.1 protein NRDE2 homolog [Onthophagus taurus]